MPRKFLILVPLIFLFAGAVFVLWKVFDQTPMTPKSGALDSRPECGHSPPIHISSPVIDAIKNVPGFHDCQKLIVVDSTTRVRSYGTLAAIFASATLGSLSDPPVSTAGGSNTAGGPGGSGGTNSGGVLMQSATVVAIVWAETRHERLGIEAGLNCLYLIFSRSLVNNVPSLTDWRARMVPKGTSDATCGETSLNNLPSGTDLEVRRTQVAGFTAPTDYPPVARWDWDPQHMEQYIGIACATAWCDVGPAGFTPSAALPVDANASTGERRVRVIKGWYDQQYLAKNGPGNTIVPSSIMGTIIADPELGDREQSEFDDGYVDVALVTLAADPGSDETAAFDEYKKKHNFASDRSTQLSIRSSAGEYWSMRIQRAAGWFRFVSRKHKNVKMRPMETAVVGTYAVPAVARWRWMRNDEGTWTRCTDGCCEMSDY